MTKDFIEVQHLKVMARIGVHTWEQRITQPLTVSVKIPLVNYPQQDELSATINYALLCEKITNFVAGSTCQLIETLAEQLALFIKKDFSLPEIELTIAKPYAIKQAENVSLTIVR